MSGSTSFGDIQAAPSGVIESVEAPPAESEWPIVSSRLLSTDELEVTSHGENETIIVVLKLKDPKTGSVRFGDPPGGTFLVVRPITVVRQP